ncbi:MAG: TRAP transporter permease [Calditerrivibrio sp.]|nr:TRAP transporter permease [Calditerrivibrio sp.]MCA1980502.1 TRAP transporter permease [Calditerrivibrio sp.]
MSVENGSVDVVEDKSGESATSKRVLTGNIEKFVYWFAVVTSLIHLWYNSFGILPELRLNAIHYGMMLFMGFLMFPISKGLAKKTFTLDLILSILAICVTLYLLLFEEYLNLRNQEVNTYDMIAAAIAMLLLLEITRRTTGITIPLIAIFFMFYALFLGKIFGGLWNFPGVSVSRFLYRMFFAPDGIFGSVTTISSTFVFLFVLFSSFMVKSGAGDFILKLAISMFGHTTGGPAKMAIFASAIMGTVSGSAVANAVGTGSITIPLMKSMGYKPKFAAGVETAASTGGQIMPPIMGAGAFIMAQWTQLPYSKIVAVSIIPALMYFLSVGFFVHLEAQKYNLRRIPKSELPSTKEVLKEGWQFFIPIIVLIYLLMANYTPTFSASIGILAVIISSWFNKKTRMKLSDIFDALSLGARNMVNTAIVLMCAGIVVGVVLLVGMGIKFSILIGDLAHGNLFLAIVFVALVSLILGMGLPVTASYIVLAVLAAPLLESLILKDYFINTLQMTPDMLKDPNIIAGMKALVPPDLAMGALLSAHLLIFWYSQDANVTPPVALVAYAAAGISGSKPFETAMESWKLAKGLYLIPLMFIYDPAILFFGTIDRTIENIITGTLGLLILAIFFEGYFFRNLSWLERIVYAFAGLLMIWPERISNYVGIVIFVVLTFYIYRTAKKMKNISIGEDSQGAI